MPLARVRVRNEYGLGAPELYRASDSEDPKAILDGVAVAGLVGILRQLGDLAEFASEVFHDLQEQVMATASRSHKMMVRVQNIETALPPLEKAVMSQLSHLHFAYTAGSDWHRKIRTEKNHLIYSDLPQFFVDSYEECRDPPHLHLLDKFDTGGSGACMKRYSDPSFFGRVLASSESTDADKVKREKKARKTKRRGSRYKNGEISRVGLTACHSGRMQSASQNIHGQSSATETVPLCDVRSNSELQDRSMSFDSRSRMLFASPTINGQSSDAETVSLFDVRSNSELQDLSPSFDPRNKMGCIEFVLDGSSSIQTEKQETDELFTSRLKTECNETLSSVVPDKLNETMDDDLTHGSSQEQSAPNSSFVSWDEKTEIIKSDLQCGDIENDQCETSELHAVSSGISELVQEASSLGYANSDEILFIDENMPASVTVGNQFEEIESELDNYMDALNTMESEVETDFECQTKREVDYASFNFESTDGEHGAGKNKMVKMIAQNSDSSDTEPHTPSYGSSSEEMSQISNKVIAAESFPTPEGPARADFCENSGILIDSRENVFEPVTSDPSLSGMPNSHAPLSDKIESSLSKSQESDVETSSTSPIQFWTNGGLLGLEPSKPPDCSLSNVPNQSSLADTKDSSYDVSRNSVVPRSHSDEYVGKLEKELDSVGGKFKSSDSISPAEDHLVRNVVNIVQPISHSQCSTLCNDKQNDCGSRKEVPFESNFLETNIEKSEVSHNTSSHSPELPVVSVVKTPFDEAGQENTESSSNMFDLVHKILVNGFRSKVSLHEERSEPACSVKISPVMSQEPPRNKQMKGKARVEHQTSLERTPKEQTECESPENSPSSSPPLEHMNISFHSINGFETSKLKLKFPDGHRFHENIRDVIFPSFQLLPERSTRQDIDSESDDDTFCRSSPCTSEDLLRHHSESSSEQWESGDSTGSEDNELHDALHRVSSAESISASLEHFHSGPSLDLPSFDALNPLMDQHESISSSVPKDLLEPQLQYLNEPLAPQPPLPPLQWCTVMPHLDEVEDKLGATSDVVDHPNDPLVPGSTNCQKPIPGLPKQPHIKEATECPVNDKELNEPRESSQAANAKEVDEREDLMYQIRAKQFNLRRTIPTRQSLTPDAPTNVKVAAILEKANAIRQACVGSDEGVDENWSDD
ncbi:protein SCAR3-like isoform X2 [Telopea speciosissima]|uniref:protein SCAR3-like isoform X2 n=1 Tax=Telopea speciosissima TaxID=54955 RepID=UPI001CC4FB41|nr:protein SCAR3-like isoform X2 [Telopea speciosissima]